MSVTAIRATKPSSFSDILDKGLVIDAFVRVSLIGIEIVTIDARIVIASVDTYLRFAEAVNRLDLLSSGKRPPGLPQFLGAEDGGSVPESMAAKKTRGALRGVKQTASDIIGKVRRGRAHDEREERRGRVDDEEDDDVDEDDDN
jgi:hypothetical protein